MIATVLNEYGSLPAWFGGLARQTFVPDECVIVDGGSTDGTLEYLRSASAPFPTRIISAPGSNISTGRNIAIEHTSAEIIATTDAGTVADTEWLEKLIRPFERRRTDVVAGFFRPSYSSLWEEALAASTIPDLPEIDASYVLASSRSFAFRRSWFEQGFMYPEWLDFCEDVVLNLSLARAEACQVFAPDAFVSFRPRRHPAGYAKQYYTYARGDGKSGIYAHRHAIRYASYLAASIVALRRNPREIGALAAVALIHLLQPMRRFWTRRNVESRTDRIVILVGLIVAQRALGDFAKMAGYPVGLLRRLCFDRSGKLWKSQWVNRGSAGYLRPSATRTRAFQRREERIDDVSQESKRGSLPDGSRSLPRG